MSIGGWFVMFDFRLDCCGIRHCRRMADTGVATDSLPGAADQR
jgi:hypothetical protein